MVPVISRNLKKVCGGIGAKSPVPILPRHRNRAYFRCSAPPGFNFPQEMTPKKSMWRNRGEIEPGPGPHFTSGNDPWESLRFAPLIWIPFLGDPRTAVPQEMTPGNRCDSPPLVRTTFLGGPRTL
jgi:hypothetical protein